MRGVATRAGIADEPDLQHAYQHGRKNGDRIRREVFQSWVPGTLAPSVTPNSTLDTYAAICNIHVYQIIRDERRYTPARIEVWWASTLSQLLLPTTSSAPAASDAFSAGPISL